MYLKGKKGKKKKKKVIKINSFYASLYDSHHLGIYSATCRIFDRWSKKNHNKYAVMVVPSQDLNWTPCKITSAALLPYYPSWHLPRRTKENHETPSKNRQCHGQNSNLTP